MLLSQTQAQDAGVHAFHPVIRQALTWIDAQDFSTMAPGKYDILPDNQMFCLLQQANTCPAEQQRPESHFRYVDLQYLLSGEETIGVCHYRPQFPLMAKSATRKTSFFISRSAVKPRFRCNRGCLPCSFRKMSTGHAARPISLWRSPRP